MRTIKFRAWQHHKNNDDNGWMTFYELKQENLPELILTDTDKNKEQLQRGRNFVRECKKEMDYAIMRFTGLKDSKGVEIYEGDMVTGLYEGKEMTEPAEVINTLYEGYQYQMPDVTHERMNAIGLPEIIGNIYENKDLLKPTHIKGRKK